MPQQLEVSQNTPRSSGNGLSGGSPMITALGLNNGKSSDIVSVSHGTIHHPNAGMLHVPLQYPTQTTLGPATTTTYGLPQYTAAPVQLPVYQQLQLAPVQQITPVEIAVAPIQQAAPIEIKR